jgi:hypothetical protein
MNLYKAIMILEDLHEYLADEENKTPLLKVINWLKEKEE